MTSSSLEKARITRLLQRFTRRGHAPLRTRSADRFRPRFDSLEDRVVPAGGDFSLDFVASAPFTYNHATGGGAFDDRTIGKRADVVESLEGGDFACGDIVTYLVEVTVDDGAVGAQTIDLDFAFLADTTGQPGAGHDDIVGVAVNYGPIAPFDVDGDGDLDVVGDGPGGTDSGNQDDGGSVATLVSETLPTNPFTNQATDLKGTVRLTDLEAGEAVILRVDVHIDCAHDSDPTGNLQAAITAGRVVSPTPDTISVGNQTVPFKNIADLREPSFTIDKTGDELSKIGDLTSFTITIVNDGDLPLHAQSIVDSMKGPITAGEFTEIGGLDNNVLDVGETWRITYSAAIPAGASDPFVNTVTATFDTSAGLNGSEVANSESHSVNLFQPSITLDKAVDDALATVGDTITYTITVTNTSSADSPNLVGNVVDALLGINQAVNLAPGQSVTINKAFTITSLTPDPLVNTATVTTSPVGFPNVIAASDSERVELFQPSIRIDKSGDALSKVGDPVAYTIVVTNTSSSDSPNLVGTLTDVLLGINQAINLAPGQSLTLNPSYVVQPGDPDPLVNTASVTATPVGSVLAVSASDDHTVNLFQPSIDLTKGANRTSAAVGDTVVYTLTVHNTSSGDSPNLVGTLSDPLLGFSTPINLAPGQSVSFDVSYVVQSGDPDPLTNTARVDTSPVGFPNEIDDVASYVLNLFQPSIAIDKSGDTLSKVGDPVDYLITVTNTSSPDSPNLVGTVSDPLLGFSAPINLAPGQSVSFPLVYVVPAGAPDPLLNTASVTATPVGSVSAVGASDGHSVNLIQPNFGIDKQFLGDPTTPVLVGQTITYRVIIGDTSSADSTGLFPVSISDTKAGPLSPSAFEESLIDNDTLDVGETWTLDYTYVVQDGDVPSFTNVVTALFQVVQAPAQGFTGTNQYTRSDAETLQADFPPEGRVTPTGTSPQQYVDFICNGGDDPGDNGDFADGGFNFTVKGGKIDNVTNPGAAFYYTNFVATSTNFTVGVNQSSTLGGPEMKLTDLQMGVVDVDPVTGRCTFRPLIGNLDFADSTDPSGISLTISAADVGKELVIRWRIDPKSIVGASYNGGTYKLTFTQTLNGSELASQTDDILVIRG